MLVFENLPETIDNEVFKTQLILNGLTVFVKSDEKIYAVEGGLSGKQNVNYLPQEFTTNNPVIGNISGINGVDGVVCFLTEYDRISNASGLHTVGGLSNLITTTAQLLSDNISSINAAQINTRVQCLFTAENSAQIQSAEKVLRDLYSGKPYKIVKSELLGRVNVNPLSTTGNSQNLIQLVELHQYILSEFYHSLGVNCPFNMKRERLNTAEVEQTTDSLKTPLLNIENTLTKYIKQVNEIFDLNIKFKINEKFVTSQNKDGEKNVDAKKSPNEGENVGG